MLMHQARLRDQTDVMVEPPPRTMPPMDGYSLSFNAEPLLRQKQQDSPSVFMQGLQPPPLLQPQQQSQPLMASATPPPASQGPRMMSAADLEARMLSSAQEQQDQTGILMGAPLAGGQSNEGLLTQQQFMAYQQQMMAQQQQQQQFPPPPGMMMPPGTPPHPQHFSPHAPPPPYYGMSSPYGPPSMPPGYPPHQPLPSPGGGGGPPMIHQGAISAADLEARMTFPPPPPPPHPPPPPPGGPPGAGGWDMPSSGAGLTQAELSARNVPHQPFQHAGGSNQQVRAHLYGWNSNLASHSFHKSLLGGLASAPLAMGWLLPLVAAAGGGRSGPRGTGVEALQEAASGVGETAGLVGSS